MTARKGDTLAAHFQDDAKFVHTGGAWSQTQKLEIIRSNRAHCRHSEILDPLVKVIGPTAIPRGSTITSTLNDSEAVCDLAWLLPPVRMPEITSLR